MAMGRVGKGIPCFPPELSRWSGRGDHSTGRKLKLAFTLWLCLHVLLTRMWKLLGPCDGLGGRVQRVPWGGGGGRRWQTLVASPTASPFHPAQQQVKPGLAIGHYKPSLGDGLAAPQPRQGKLRQPLWASPPLAPTSSQSGSKCWKVDTPLGQPSSRHRRFVYKHRSSPRGTQGWGPSPQW